MPRKEGRARRLVVGPDTYLWSVRHQHRTAAQAPERCQEHMVTRRVGSPGELRIVFAPGPGRDVPDGWLPSGHVSDGATWLNLHEPGTVRALLDGAIARGWDPSLRSPTVLDGWPLLHEVAPLRRPTPGSGKPSATRPGAGVPPG